GAEHDEAPQRDRCAHHAASRLRAEPAGAETCRGDLRLAQDGGTAAPDPPPGAAAGRLDVGLPARGLEPVADSQFALAAALNARTGNAPTRPPGRPRRTQA